MKRKWHVGDKCKVKQYSGATIPDMEIVSIDNKTKTCKVLNTEIDTFFTADLEQLIEPDN